MNDGIEKVRVVVVRLRKLRRGQRLEEDEERLLDDTILELDEALTILESEPDEEKAWARVRRIVTRLAWWLLLAAVDCDADAA